MYRFPWKFFISLIFHLDKFRQNCRDDLLFDHMLAILSGLELGLVALPDIFDTFACCLCCPCLVGWIVPWVGIFFVGCQAYSFIEHRQQKFSNQSVTLSYNWWNWCHIYPDIFIPYLGVSVGSITVHSC